MSNMTIKEAKEEIKKAVQVNLEKNKSGEYMVPLVRQRPVFLQGAPGIGKTAIMEQIASELDIALVSYSMTHHTRQSAIGLPIVKEKQYGDKTYMISEYTMSEIIASVYDVMEKSGKKEGILFLDEINCVSETLAPSMLLFLQYKRFGNQTLPEGWVVVTAGNPPQFNKSVKDFDVATQDRLKMMNIEASFEVWREYAYNAGIHPAIIAFLEMNPQWFYKISTSVDGKKYITARGWEDLSVEIQAYERHGFTVKEDLVMQYITDTECARKFAVYYDLFKKYRVDYAISDILNGDINTDAVDRAKGAAFDERLSIISMIMEYLGNNSKEVVTKDAALHDVVKRLRVIKKDAKSDENSVYEMLNENIGSVKDEMDRAKAANALSSFKKAVMISVTEYLDKYKDTLEKDNLLSKSNDVQFKAVKDAFKKDTNSLSRKQGRVDESMTNAFKYIDEAWGNEQEMTMFVTKLTVNGYIADYLATYSNDEYLAHNSSMLIYDTANELQTEIDSLLDIA